ncbi:hypothetical protein [Chitinophaga japonensis]|nr:hypothetical protein [Chitinophaga japonensis]
MTKQSALQQLEAAKTKGYTNLYYTDVEGWGTAIARGNYATSSDQAMLLLAADNNYAQDCNDDDEIIARVSAAPWAFWTPIDEAIGYVKESELPEDKTYVVETIGGCYLDNEFNETATLKWAAAFDTYDDAEEFLALYQMDAKGKVLGKVIEVGQIY